MTSAPRFGVWDVSITELIRRIRPIPAHRWRVYFHGSAPAVATEHQLTFNERGLVAQWRWPGHALELRFGPKVSGQLDGVSLLGLDIRGTVGTEGKWWQGWLVLRLLHSDGMIRLAGRLW